MNMIERKRGIRRPQKVCGVLKTVVSSQVPLQQADSFNMNESQSQIICPSETHCRQIYISIVPRVDSLTTSRAIAVDLRRLAASPIRNEPQPVKPSASSRRPASSRKTTRPNAPPIMRTQPASGGGGLRPCIQQIALKPPPPSRQAPSQARPSGPRSWSQTRKQIRWSRPRGIRGRGHPWVMARGTLRAAAANRSLGWGSGDVAGIFSMSPSLVLPCALAPPPPFLPLAPDVETIYRRGGNPIMRRWVLG
jgi:hypothetical protein